MPNYWYHHVHLTSPNALKTAEFYEKFFHAKRVSARKMPNGAMMVSLCMFRSKSAGVPEQTGHHSGRNRPPYRSKSATPAG